jgi:hypothetical protein
MADRGLWVAGMEVGGNVRRLMYQSLIWSLVLGNDPGRLRAPLDAEDGESLADALVDRMRRDVELGRNFLGAEMLIDEQEAIELASSKTGDARGHHILRTRTRAIGRRTMRSVRIIQKNTHPAKHAALPSRVHASLYVISRTLASFPLISLHFRA